MSKLHKPWCILKSTPHLDTRWVQAPGTSVRAALLTTPRCLRAFRWGPIIICFNILGMFAHDNVVYDTSPDADSRIASGRGGGLCYAQLSVPYLSGYRCSCSWYTTDYHLLPLLSLTMAHFVHLSVIVAISFCYDLKTTIAYLAKYHSSFWLRLLEV